MLLAEDLLLLVTDDASGRLCAPPAQVDAGLGGANLMELTLINKVDLSDEHDTSGPGRIIVRDPAPTSDAVLDAALNVIIAHQGQKPSTLIRPLGKNLRQTLYERLASRAAPRRPGPDPRPFPSPQVASSRLPPRGRSAPAADPGTRAAGHPR